MVILGFIFMSAGKTISLIIRNTLAWHHLIHPRHLFMITIIVIIILIKRAFSWWGKTRWSPDWLTDSKSLLLYSTLNNVMIIVRISVIKMRYMKLWTTKRSPSSPSSIIIILDFETNHITIVIIIGFVYVHSPIGSRSKCDYRRKTERPTDCNHCNHLQWVARITSFSNSSRRWWHCMDIFNKKI